MEETEKKDIIVLKSVFKNGKYTVQPAKDPKTNWFHGIKRLSEDQKRNLKFWTSPDSKLTLVDGIEFDLNDEIQAANWEWVKHLPCVAMDFDSCQKTPSAQFYVHIAGREAREANKATDLKFRAMKYIMEDSPSEYENRALLLDNDLTGESPEEIKTVLLGIAERQPTRIIAAYEAKNSNIKLLYIKAKQRNIIEQKDGVITFGSYILGVNQDSAIAFLQAKEHDQILKLLEKDVEVHIDLEGASSSKSKQYNFSKNK